MAEIPTHHWLALCLLTETNRPEEWPYVAGVIRRRCLSDRYPTKMRDVILQKSQFSAFNFIDRRMGPSAIFELVAERYSAADLMSAADLAGAIARSEIPETITPETLHYYSPVSMVPKFSAPAWAKTAKRLFTPEGVDPKRFVFAESVA